MTYAVAAPLYRQAGWVGVLPLPTRAKKNPPAGYTGAAGVDPTDHDIATWAALHPDGNLAIRMPPTIIGIDIDAYKDQTARARLEAFLGCQLPPTIASGSKSDGSGIYLYRVQPLPEDKRWADAPVDAVEVVQRGHRYAIVWPSIHPDGLGYRWWDTSSGEILDGPPSIDDDRIADLPWLAQQALIIDKAVYDPRDAVHLEMPAGPMSPKVRSKLNEGIGVTVTAAGGRHDRVRDIVAALIRLGDLGEPGVPDALAELKGRFVAAVTPDRPSPTHAALEFDDLVTGGITLVSTTESTVTLLPPVTVLPELPRVEGDIDYVGSSWQRNDLAGTVAGIQNGTLRPAEPTLGRLPDGGALFYPGRVNGLYGEPGKGKTWVALAIVAEVLTDGGTVAWIDLEEPAHGIVQRLLDLGVDPRAIVEQFAHFAPEEPIRNAHALERELTGLNPTLAVIDSTGEALALEGAGPNNDDEVASWFRTWPRWIANLTGAGVIVIDHVVKDETARGLWPGGSQRKKAAISGSAFMTSTVNELGRGHEGRLSLTTSKDRQGHHRVRTPAALFVLDARDAARLSWSLQMPTTTDSDFRPTTLMEKVSRHLEEQAGPLVQRDILRDIVGKDGFIRDALKSLVAEGFISVAVDNRQHHYQSIRPYRDGDVTVLPEVVV